MEIHRNRYDRVFNTSILVFFKNNSSEGAHYVKSKKKKAGGRLYHLLVYVLPKRAQLYHLDRKQSRSVTAMGLRQSE